MLPLPFDVPVAQDSTASMFGEGQFAGFEDVEITPLPWISAMPRTGLRPTTSLWFRRGEIAYPSPWDAISSTFGDHFPQPHGAIEEEPYRLPRAVVQVSCIAPGDPSADEEASKAWLSEQFDAGLQYLNEFLTVLASVANEPAIGPITMYELPPAVPFVTVNLSDSRARDEPVEPSMMMLHFGIPGVAEEIPRERFEQVGRIQALQRRTGHPFAAYAEAMVAARRSLDLGQVRLAVMEAGTGIELLVSTVVREVAAARNEPADQIAARSRSSFRNRVVDHFVPLTGLRGSIDDDSTELGSWWKRGYLLRNRVTHDGHRPSHSEAVECLAAARDLMAATGRALHADPATKRLGDLLVTFEQEPRWRRLTRRFKFARRPD